jgi:hypothetical protein
MPIETRDGVEIEFWYRVEAQYGRASNYTGEQDANGPWVFIGQANGRSDYLALADRAYKDGAVNVRVVRCERVF